MYPLRKSSLNVFSEIINTVIKEAINKLAYRNNCPSSSIRKIRNITENTDKGR
jgi:hypothetical protein